jgi:hypothetical protein
VFNAGSAVATVTGDGEFESYNYYTNGNDGMRFSVRDRAEKVAGGIDNEGRIVTGAPSAPDTNAMARGEARTWFNPDPVNGGLMVTMKFSDGSVKTKKIA